MSNNVHSSVRHSFIFPVYNEASYLSPQLKLFYQLLEKNYFTQFEVLLIENGSTDQTWATMQRLAKKYPGLRNLRISQASYGQALKHGILSALGQKIYVLNIDFFNSNFISQAKKLLDKYEIVVGSKTLRESQDHRGLLRQIQTKIFHQSLKMLFSYPGTDTHGLKAFRSTPALIKTLRACSVKHELLDTELLLKLCQQKQSLQEVPVVVRELRPTRYTSWRRVRLTLIDLWRIITFKLGGYLSNNSNNQLSRLPVIADDYGLSSVVNEAVIDQAAAKNLTGVSVLVNLVSTIDSRKLLAYQRSVKIGLHLNLTRGKPITIQKLVSSLIDQQGNFFSLPVLLTKLFFGQVKLTEVKLEFTNQFKYLKKLGFAVNYLDSEQHLHTFFPIKQIVEEMAAQHQVQIRGTSSTTNYLRLRPQKYLPFLLLQTLLNLKQLLLIHPKQKSKLFFDVQITHPGSLYD
ncbi:MAG: Glycosyl transferase family 2 [Candidatus Pacebacteria bacterium GW2011_GWA1_46_10]|nr:MAG: Glycosyl transferase family 2 [Candidatus Pacebacteria bacterium GW2011_GWA1_46_10]HCR80985.1 hypothetical protein [Candidatus Paceibacterota bacterium]